LTGQVIYHDEFREGPVAYGVQEEIRSPDIKPFYLGFVAFSASGKIAWQRPQSRISYRIHPDEKMARILDVVVQPQYRGSNIGKRLVEIAERRFRAHGITKVKGYAEPAIHGFWQKLGYRVDDNNEILKEL